MGDALWVRTQLLFADYLEFCAREPAAVLHQAPGHRSCGLGDPDGFCLSFGGPLPLSYWKARLVQTFLSCVLATVLIYLWTRVYRFL
ncbi:bcl-2-like protein 10 [Octodon degus]|uniref:Bcl-2-like protein 10 n=1 Tax=Octodon degus TaxID=10160 RepID=A0A6P3FJT3_OCTDE|nr:bcl-2-like protein 10 [Octodon degus]